MVYPYGYRPGAASVNEPARWRRVQMRPRCMRVSSGGVQRRGGWVGCGWWCAEAWWVGGLWWEGYRAHPQPASKAKIGRER